MRPTVRSRLWAAGTAFVAGFVIANVGILLITGADRWLWLATAVVLMITGAVGAPYLIWLLATVNREGRGG